MFNQSAKVNRTFWLVTVGVTLAVIAVVNAPMLVGKVPFPSNYIFCFPPFAKSAPPDAPAMQADVGDLVTQFYPIRKMTSDSVRSGEVPLWDPHLLSGTPLLASIQSAIFYPPNFLYDFLPLALAWTLTFVLRSLLAAVLMAAFVRGIGGTPAGSIVAGLLFAFGGFVTVYQGMPTADAAIWLPLICLSVIRLHSDPSMKNIVLTTVAFSMPVLAGHPETAAHLTLTGVALAAFLFVTKPNRRFIGFFAIAGVFAMGLAAVQILPTIEWLGLAYHSITASRGTLPWWTLISFVSRDIVSFYSASGLWIPEQVAYIGMMCFVAAPLAFLHRSRRLATFLLAWGVIAMCAAWGIWPVSWVVEHTPVLKALKNTRLILIAGFSAAALAGLGLSFAEESLATETGKRKFRAALLIAMGLSIGLILIYALRLSTTTVSEPLRWPRTSALLLLASAAPLLLKLGGRLSRRQFQIMTVAIVAFDVVTFSHGYLPFTKPADIFAPNQLFDRIRKGGPEPFRVTQMRNAYGTNFEAMYGLDAVTGYDVVLARPKLFLDGLGGPEEDYVTFDSAAILGLKDRRLDMLNTKYYLVSEYDPRYREFRKQPDRFRFLYESGDTDVIENLKVLPPAFLVPTSGVEVIPDDVQAINRIKDLSFDPEQSVVLPVAIATDAMRQTGPSTVEWTSRSDNSFQLKTRAAQSAVLVVSQIFYPGWKAYVDGRQVPVMPANYALTAIAVDAGSHDVRFVYDPMSFKIGWIVSLATLVLLIGGAFLTRKTQQK